MDRILIKDLVVRGILGINPDDNTSTRSAGFMATHGDCSTCHNPHGSDYKFLLIGDILGGQVCSQCHY